MTDNADTMPLSYRRSHTVTPVAAIICVLALLFVVSVAAGLSIGPASISPWDVLAALGGEGTRQADAILAIRAPRVALAMATGGGLAVAGAALQALFRNPLADP